MSRLAARADHADLGMISLRRESLATNHVSGKHHPAPDREGLAVAIACLFALVRVDVGPFTALERPLIACLIATTAQDALVQSPIQTVRLGALAGCGATSIWVAMQLALSAAHLVAQKKAAWDQD